MIVKTLASKCCLRFGENRPRQVCCKSGILRCGSMGHPEVQIISPSSNPGKETGHLQIFESQKHDNSSEHEQVEDTFDFHSKNLRVFPLSEQATHITRVSIDYNQISQLPTKLSEQFPQLESFNANGNEIFVLPDDFGEFSHLQELCLCENRLVSLPESLHKLKKLKVLRVNANLLKRLYAEIGQNSYLEILCVDENKLKRFPATLGLLRNLRVLEAANNRLEVLPSTLNFLENLRSVDLSNNRLTEIPESFGQLRNLTHIDLSENKIRHLCNIFQSTKTLQCLFLDMNVFSRCPDWFRDLEGIEEIRMKCNELSGLALPEGFGLKSRHLKILDLRGNFIEELPTSIRHLCSLKSLLLGTPENCFERNPSFQSGNWLRLLPCNFAELVVLRELYLAENQLEALPEDIGKLVHLEDIFLGSNLLVELPVSFTKLTALKRCQLSKNRLKRLPESIGALELLTEFHLDSNQLKTLPSSMKKLTNLEILDLSKNKLKQAPGDIISALTKLKSLSLHDNKFDVHVINIPNKRAHSSEQKKDCGRNRWRDRHSRRSLMASETNKDLVEASASKNEMSTSSSDSRYQDTDDGDVEEDWDLEAGRHSTSSSSSESEQLQPNMEEEEEEWGVVAENDNAGSSFRSGQFDLDDEDSPEQVFIPAPVRFDYYGNCSGYIHVDIQSHCSTPYIYHVPKVRFPYEPGCEVAGQFDSDDDSCQYH